jgi:hypothetical protein
MMLHGLVDSHVSKECAVSIYPEDGGTPVLKMLITVYQTVWHHFPEDGIFTD